MVLSVRAPPYVKPGGEDKRGDTHSLRGNSHTKWVMTSFPRSAWGRENAWNPRGFIAQNPRKVRGVHKLRGNVPDLTIYHYSGFCFKKYPGV